MTIQDWGAVGEIVGGIAVLVTLIYLAIQLRQSNLATHRNTYASAADTMSAFWLDMARNPELFQRFQTSLRAPDRLSREELDQGFLVLDAYMALMESYYLHNRTYGEDISQARWERSLTRLLNLPGGQRYWRSRRAAFHEEFADYISGLISDESPAQEAQASSSTR